jgi:ferredoxin--NADP+ reductase
MKTKELNAVVAQKVEVAPGLIILRIIPDGWELPEFTAGQFGVLGLYGDAPRYAYAEKEDSPPPPADKLIRRAYSVSSSSIEKEYIEFYIRLVSSGELTPRIFNLTVGDRLWLGPKIKGLFTLDDVEKDQNIVFLATGTGIAPYMSMLRSHVITQEKRNFAIVHGAASSWDLGYRSELITIARLSPNFHYIPVISSPEKEPVKWNGETGFIDSVWNNNIIQAKWGSDQIPENTHFFLCGNPHMITTMTEKLTAAGFKEHSRKEPGNIHLEKFW